MCDKVFDILDNFSMRFICVDEMELLHFPLIPCQKQRDFDNKAVKNVFVNSAE